MPNKLLLTGAVFWLCLLSGPAGAQSLIRDSGIEYALDRIARPLFTAAGLPARRTRVLIVDDMNMNAFVVDRRTVFIHAGLFMRLGSAEELQAVIAHELAHISNGHFARRRLNMQNARRRAMAGLALGVAAGAASGQPGAGVGIAIGAQSTAMNMFLRHTREEEASADKSGMRYLAIAGIDPAAMRGVLELFDAKSALMPEQRGYTTTHPLTQDRLRAVDLTVSQLEPGQPASDPEVAAYWFDRSKAKLVSYMRTPGYTVQRYAGDDSDAGLIARSMAAFKSSDMGTAQDLLAKLAERRPDDAFVHELRGWMLVEAGDPRAALPHYARAAELAPSAPLIAAGRGRALLALDTPETDAQALEALESAYARDRRNGALLRDMAVAYARTGENGMASLVTAERYAMRGDIEDAGIHARRAAGLLPVGSPGWARAQDMIRTAETSQRR